MNAPRGLVGLVMAAGILWAGPVAAADGTKLDGIGSLAPGDSKSQLVYTPVEPCRIVDTRVTGGSLAAGAIRDFRVTGFDLSSQGGNASGCRVPHGRATAALINFVAVTPTGPGNLRVWAYRTPPTGPPDSSVLNYNFVPGSGLSIANAIAVPICDPTEPGQSCPLDIRVRADGNGTHLVADVVGFFERFPTEQLSALTLPVGAIIIWDQSDSCPAGYVPVGAFNGRFLRGAHDSPGGTGGGVDHLHGISHRHGLGDHNHGTGTTSVSTTVGLFGSTRPIFSASRTPHAHTYFTWGPSIDLTDEPVPGTSDPVSHLPPYSNVMYCRKAAAPGARPSTAVPMTLGDTKAQLVYTPVTPCRIIDTRSASGSLTDGTPRDFQVTSTDLSPQGGNPNGCGVPSGRATAALINFVAVQPTGRGNLRAWPYHTPPVAPPDASVLNYALIAGSPLNIANGIAIPICDPAVPGQTCTNEFRVQVDGSNTHLVADVVGFFERFPTEQVAPSVVPTGAIVAWKESDNCPPSYARVGTMDGRFLRAESTPGGAGGAEAHRHDFPHTHGINHTHSGSTSASSTIARVGDGFGGCAAHEHTHDFTSDGPSPNVSGGASSPTTGWSSHLPTYSNVLFCRKIAEGPPVRAEREGRSTGDGLEPRVPGDPDAHLVYTPVSPCRIVDTRAAGGALAGGGPRNFQVTGANLSSQGGSGTGCDVPRGRGAVAFINLVAVRPTGRGNLRAWAFRTPEAPPPTASALNYALVEGSGLNIANAIPIPICDPTEAGQTCTADFRVQADGSDTHLVADVVGFWERFPIEQLAVPAGVLIVWEGASCPMGYTRSAALDGRFLRGSPTAGGVGGADSHTHDMAHTHGMGHTHSVTTDYPGAIECAGSTTGSISAGGGHRHTFTTGGPSIDVTGDATSSSTVEATSLPPYMDVVFCRKS